MAYYDKLKKNHRILPDPDLLLWWSKLADSPQVVDVPVLQDAVNGGVNRDELEVHVTSTLPPRDLNQTGIN